MHNGQYWVFKQLTIWHELPRVLYLIPCTGVSFVWMMMTVVLNSFCLCILPYACHLGNGMMSVVVVYDSSYSLKLFSRPFLGILITVTIKPNV